MGRLDNGDKGTEGRIVGTRGMKRRAETGDEGEGRGKKEIGGVDRNKGRMGTWGERVGSENEDE